jgi:hypothetical protein
MGWESSRWRTFCGSKRFKSLKKLNREGLDATNVMHITWLKPECI